MYLISTYIKNWKQNIEHLTFYFRSFNMDNEIEDFVSEAILSIQRTNPEVESQLHFNRIVRRKVNQKLIDKTRKNINTVDISYCDKVSVMQPGLDESYFLGIIETMPKKMKRIIKLRANGCSYNEIVEETRQNLNTVKGHIFRARKFLIHKYHEEINNYYNCAYQLSKL